MAGSVRELFAKVKSIDERHGKFDFVLCLGDFFGPPKDAEEAYEGDHEIIQLLDGRLEGRVNPGISMYVSLSTLCFSPNRMLHYARRAPPTSPGRREVRKNGRSSEPKCLPSP